MEEAEHNYGMPFHWTPEQVMRKHNERAAKEQKEANKKLQSIKTPSAEL
jgi:hypothetical protein